LIKIPFNEKIINDVPLYCKPIKTNKMRTLLLIIFSMFFLTAYSPENTVNTAIDARLMKIKYIEYSAFTPELFYEYMQLIDVQQVKFSYAMAKLETGNFTSFLFENNCNLFGMRHPNVRPTLSRASIYEHAFYSHWTESVRDYKLWQDYMQSHNYDLSDYPAFLKKAGYSVNTGYVKLVKQLMP
jgi:uncharacterized FlgJ-related protein